MLRKLVPGLVIVAMLSIAFGVPLAFAQVTNTPPSSVGSPPLGGPVALPTPPASVTIVRRPPPPPFVQPVPCAGGGLGQVNPPPSALNPGSTDFRPGVCNPLNDPHPMLPWGDGQIGGERYGQVVRYWQNQPQTVSNVIFVGLAEESTTPEAAPPSSEPQPQSQPSTPSSPPSAPQAMLDTKLVRELRGQDVTVPASWIVETTRGYIHMPRWALQEVGGGRYQWVLVGAWFQPR